MQPSDFPDYDAGLLNDYGGGDTAWWLYYIRTEIRRANDHWRENLAAALATIKAEPAAWLHTLHMEHGQSRSRASLSPKHPFGKRGADYDPSYSVTTAPLYTDPPAAPDGWRLVPVEPTPEMARNGAISIWLAAGPVTGIWIKAVAEAYRAMLAAAPAPGGQNDD